MNSQDIIFIGASAAFFILSAAYATFCGKIR